MAPVKNLRFGDYNDLYQIMQDLPVLNEDSNILCETTLYYLPLTESNYIESTLEKDVVEVNSAAITPDNVEVNIEFIPQRFVTESDVMGTDQPESYLPLSVLTNRSWEVTLPDITETDAQMDSLQDEIANSQLELGVAKQRVVVGKKLVYPFINGLGYNIILEEEIDTTLRSNTYALVKIIFSDKNEINILSDGNYVSQLLVHDIVVR